MTVPETNGPGERSVSTAPPGGPRRWWSAVPHHLGRVRTSTVVLVLLFVGLYLLYLSVRPPAEIAGTVPTTDSTVQTPARTSPAEPSEPTTAPTTTSDSTAPSPTTPPGGTAEETPTGTAEPTPTAEDEPTTQAPTTQAPTTQPPTTQPPTATGAPET